MHRKRALPIIVLAFGAAGAVAAGGASAQSGPTAVVADTNVQLYGHLDLSIDDATKGINGRVQRNGTTATGKLGWQPDVSSNLSYLGLRGNRGIADGLNVVFQIESQLDVAATPGPSPQSNSATDAKVPGAWASRNSYLGMSGGFGAVKAGKTDAPYKLSTARMDPFSASVGDYNSIMGNTGGDNRAEFDTRLSHSVWYESPKLSGLSFSALFMPGQNRSSNNTINASGEPSCTAGNNPDPTFGCNDGSFGNAYSVAGVWETGPLYAIAAYEKHTNVNRTTDEVAAGGASPNGSIGIADEKAAKLGLQYKLPTGTVLNAIWERMTRNAPNPNFNERQRNGFWLAGTQQIGSEDDLSLGWAHAGKTPGDVGTNRADGTTATGPVDNAANMYTFGYKHHFADKRTTWYLVYARMVNHNGAHYDLGASGHGITTDCHDGGISGTCFAGSTLQAVSLGMTYNF